MRLGGYLSFLPSQIISCSEVARDVHIAQHYRKEKFVVIPNGFDSELFRPDFSQREQFIIQLGLDPSAKLVGIIGRYDPQKDFPTFIQAAGIISASMNAVHFLLCGQDLDDNNAALQDLITQAGIQDKVHLLGRRSDIQKIHQSLDVLVSSSAYGEAFPNVVAEAMACGVPCVVTDVGDAGALVGETGLVVPPRNPQALADAVMRLLSLPEDQWKIKQHLARQRILDHYALPLIAQTYADVFEKNRSK
jgi:glycosyltransferase involved in cell wall biosynthesis